MRRLIPRRLMAALAGRPSGCSNYPKVPFSVLVTLAMVGCAGLTPAFPGKRYDNVVANPPPLAAIEPRVPFTGQTVTLRLAQLPANSTFELWLVPSHRVFRFGIPHPSQAGGVKLADATSDGEGKLTHTFEMKPEYPRNNGTAVGMAGIWVVYSESKVVAPEVVSWEAANPTVFQGKVYDEHGQLAPSARARLTVSRSHRAGREIYFQGEQDLHEGAYRFEQVPAPSDTEIEVILPNGSTRKRFVSTGGMQVKWGCCNGDAWLQNYGQPLTYHFGGPSVPEDPLAPGYFISNRLEDPAIATTLLTGKVYDQLGNLVLDEVNAIVIAETEPQQDAPPDRRIARVKDGAYSLTVPTGVLHLDLRIDPGAHVLIHPPAPRVFLPESLTQKPNVFNFGGPATADQPDAPKYAFPSPEPAFTGPSPGLP